MIFTRNFRMVLCAINILLILANIVFFDIVWVIINTAMAAYWCWTLEKEDKNGQ